MKFVCLLDLEVLHKTSLHLNIPYDSIPMTRKGRDSHGAAHNNYLAKAASLGVTLLAEAIEQILRFLCQKENSRSSPTSLS